MKFGFVAGEVAPAYYGRSDLEKYDLALETAENWFVDYHGGLSNVPGTAFIDHLQDKDVPLRLIPFKFSNTTANQYVVIFGDGYIRFVQNGAYVLEAAQAVTGLVLGTTTKVTIAGHGWSTGDYVSTVTAGDTVQFVNRTFRLEVIDANTFYLRDAWNAHVDSTNYTALVSGMTFARVYTLSTPYAVADLPAIKSTQVRDLIRVTHPDYKTYNLKRIAHTNWTMTVEDFKKPVNKPNITSVDTVNTPANTWSVGYAVTAVDPNGIEGLPSSLFWTTSSNDIDTVRNALNTVRYSRVAGTDYYNIYRTRLTYNPSGSGANSLLNRGYQLGFIGRSRGRSFADTGITPDFTQTPPRNLNPFAKKAIRFVNITAGGSGYTNGETFSLTDATGSGAILELICDNGAVAGFIVYEGGENYTAPVITVTGGTGFTYTVDLSPESDTDPACSAVYQQRQVYAGPRSNPLSVYGSKPGALSDFSQSTILVASDSFQHEIDSQNFSPLRHLIPTRGGLICMSAGGVWLMAGTESGAITATDVQADPNVYTGASDVIPLTIDTAIVYTSLTGGRVNSLEYADSNKLYSPADISILSSHLIATSRIVRWAYADEPSRLVYAVRDDGVMLLLTIVKDQEVYGWTRRVTKGRYLDVVSFDGDGNTDVYFAVRRKFNGKYLTVLERGCSRMAATGDDGQFLDCSLSYAKNAPAYAMQLSAATGDAVTMTVDGGVFSGASVGSIVRFGKGKARVTAVTSSIQATVKVFAPFDQLENYTNLPRTANPGEWYLDSEITTVLGLSHLEGETVTALADGAVIPNLVVSGGRVTLPKAASRVVIGIPYKSIARNLPLVVNGNVVENRRKRITNLALRILDSRGLKVGNYLNKLYPLRTASGALLGESAPLASGITHVSIEPLWSEEGQNYFVQEYPLPVTILGYILDAEIGDDK